MSASRTRRAFTLLEVLVALTLLGVLTAGVGLALRTSVDASDRVRERTEIHAEARAALDVLSSDLGAAFLSGVNTEETYFSAEPPAEAGEGRPFLRFTTLNYHQSNLRATSEEPARSDAVRVEYALEPTGPERSVLVRREQWLTETGPGERTVVCDRVAGLQLLYLGNEEPQPVWTAEAEAGAPLRVEEGEQLPEASRRTLPRGVEITLLLAPTGDREQAKPRAYKTVVLLTNSGIAPFETEVVPKQQQGAPSEGTPGPGGNPGG
jgi:prepilin-type N-terminal cleavage/methylation domain-containing protein